MSLRKTKISILCSGICLLFSGLAFAAAGNVKQILSGQKGKVDFFRHSDMDVTAMVPGLTIDVEGVGNAKGQLDASKITFYPDEFAVEVAEEQQITANKAAAAKAQQSANAAQASANQAQQSANKAQSSAN